MKLHVLASSFAVALTSAAQVSAQTPAAWNQPVNVIAAPGSLTKSGGCDLCPDAGAYSSSRITTSGYVEFVPLAGQRLTGGLTAEAVPATNGALVDYAFSIWPTGAFEVREKGVYRGEGTFVAGDRFRIALESGKIVYRRNGNAVYVSGTLPVSPLALSVTLMSTGSSISAAVTYAGSDFTTGPTSTTTTSTSGTTSTTTTTTGTTWPAGVVDWGPYRAIVERLPHAKPAVPSLGPAGTSIVDPVFGSRIYRVTDASTRPAAPGRSFRTPSGTHQNAWSALGTYFYVTSTDGTLIPYRFDASKGTALRIQPSTSGEGGMVLRFYMEPQFSYVSDTLMFGSLSGGSMRTIDQLDLSTGVYSQLLDLDTIVGGLSGTYVGGLSSTSGPVERIMTMFGGTMQDQHHYVVVFEKANPANRLVLDTKGNTLNGKPISFNLNILLHHVAIDRTGRFVMLYSTYAEQSGTRKAAQSYLWDTQTGTFTEFNTAALPYGHDAYGFGVSVNQDCCTSSTWDAAQWQFRELAVPLVTRDVITTVLQPKEIYLDDHTTWNNARPDRLVPYISGIFRSPTSTTSWRAWDDEIVAIQPDAAAGTDGAVWRFAHHRTDVHSDVDATTGSFWYQPHPNVSPDGRWVAFTSNWEKTLGTDPGGDSATRARQDVFIVELRPAGGGGTTTTPPPAPLPVAIDAVSLGAGTVAAPYTGSLHATGGSGGYVWSVTAGALPTGLTLNGTTGAVSGTPTTAGTFPFTIRVADAGAPTNAATGSYSIQVGSASVLLAPPNLPEAHVSQVYAAFLKASGGSGLYKWSVSGGSLPSGLTLDAASGAVSGTPQTAGPYAFTVRVVDAVDANAVDSAPASVVVTGLPLAVTTTLLPSGRAGAAYSATLSATGGTGSTRWAVTGGALPPGLTLSTAGLLSGTPSTDGSYAVTVTATDANDPLNKVTVAYTIDIWPGVKVVTTSLPGAKMKTPYSYTLQAAYVQGTGTWSIAGGSLPNTMSLSSGGVLSGTPKNPGSWSVTVRVKDATTEHTATLTFVVTTK